MKPWQDAMAEYRKLRVILSIHNDLNAEFSAGFAAVTCVVTVMMLYGTIVGYHVLHPLVYLLFPTSAIFAIMMQTAFYSYVSLWEIQSLEFLQLMQQNTAVMCAARRERKGMWAQLNGFVPLQCKLSFFGRVSLALSHECMGQTFSFLLLLLSS